MFHQENAGLNVEMAKLAFSKGIWSYVCKMENALRKYIAISHKPQGPILSAVSLIKKVRFISKICSAKWKQLVWSWSRFQMFAFIDIVVVPAGSIRVRKPDRGCHSLHRNY